MCGEVVAQTHLQTALHLPQVPSCFLLANPLIEEIAREIQSQGGPGVRGWGLSGEAGVRVLFQEYIKSTL